MVYLLFKIKTIFIAVAGGAMRYIARAALPAGGFDD